jgi:ubiquinone/menaquinone biosynthesis C-methylase UbiE
MDYANSRLTASYDSLNSPMVEECFYVDLAGAAPRTILDMGCGTGRLASELAAQAPGDRARSRWPMLDVARQRPRGQ